MSYRIEKINQLIRQELSDLIQRQVKDPRLTSFISITEVATSPDLRHARVFVACICEKAQREEILKGLTSAGGFFRKEMGKDLRLRRIPELSFYWDDTAERADHLTRLMDQLSTEE